VEGQGRAKQRSVCKKERLVRRENARDRDCENRRGGKRVTLGGREVPFIMMQRGEGNDRRGGGPLWERNDLYGR